MTSLNKSNAELAFRYLPKATRADVEHEAHTKTLDAWRDERPDALDKLETAHNNDSRPFEWQNIELMFERSQVDGSAELTPHTYTGDANEILHELARDFAWDYVANVREEVDELQSSTALSTEGFLVLILSVSNLSYSEAASELGISQRAFAKKMSDKVNPKIQTARETVDLVDAITSE
jgi:hypothetical protein